MKSNFMKKIGAAMALSMTLSLVGCQEVPEAKPQVIPAGEAGMQGQMGQESTTFKPADYTLPVKEEYEYAYLGLKFNLTKDFQKQMQDKNVAMLSDQSPVDKDLSHAILTFDQLTDEQKNATIDKMGEGYTQWQESLTRLGTISLLDKNMSDKDRDTLTKCDHHEKLGTSKDGKYDYYLSTNTKADPALLEEFMKTSVSLIDKKDRPENGYVLMEKDDSNLAFNPDANASQDLSDVMTTDINGKEFTGKEFSKYKLTMVNVFATWCTACVQEIPELVKLHQEMKDKGVNIIGVVTDTRDDQGVNKEALEKAKLIQEKTKTTYSLLMPDEGQFKGRLIGLQAMPETFFVDQNGNIVGDTYSGGKDSQGWKTIIEQELSKLDQK